MQFKIATFTPTMRQRSQRVKLFISCCCQLVLQLREIGLNFNYIIEKKQIIHSNLSSIITMVLQ